ncbi:MAG: ThiF family adenylyltransferase [Gammaproteobacteria bacterium]|nr:ThiF family adenylyltransferase [Gammaproteobacteria bacterium]
MNKKDSNFYDQAFSRNRGLISEREQEILNNTRVAIPGMGGMGGVHAATLARTGIGKFTIADFDAFGVHNINRQYGATASTVDKDKAQVMAGIIKDINPSAEITVINKAIGADNVDDFLADVNVMIDALDVFVMDARLVLYKKARELDIPVISAGPIGFSAVVNVFSPNGMSFEDFFGLEADMSEQEIMQCFFAGIPLGPHMRYMDLKGVDPVTGAAPSLGLACQMGAGIAATEVIRYVLGRGNMKAVPWFFQFDPYARYYKQHYRWLGGPEIHYFN